MRDTNLTPFPTPDDPARFTPGRPPSATDYHKMDMLITLVETGMIRLKAALRLRRNVADDRLPGIVDDIAREAANVTASWELVQEAARRCFDDHAVENRYADKLKTFAKKVNALQDEAQNIIQEHNRGETHAKEEPGKSPGRPAG